MEVKKVKNNTWLIEVQEDGTTKEKFIQLPAEALAQMGWAEDDTLEWEINPDNVVFIKKKDQGK